MLFGVTLVHAQQVGGEQGGLVAARAGPDLDHRGAAIGGVFGQKGQLQGGLGGFDPVPDAGQFILGQAAHFGVGPHRLGLVQLLQQRLILGHDIDHRFQVRIFTGERRGFGPGKTSRHLRLQKLETGGELLQFFKGDHLAAFPHRRDVVKALRVSRPVRAVPHSHWRPSTSPAILPH